MNWQLWTVVGFHILAVLGAFSGIDKPREPKTIEFAMASALFSIIMVMLLIWGITT